ncbi:PREDICTED: uncharacterized protein LOC106109865 [Papilio polytes]|uniref:uncharacterized protein LOC106109865 n=1 Tax=Papilio polytes TaxID=76194 RepID=UPI000675E8F3|nr:PREDICTED: uncharacterized protein LOC106109865 [Papilio polytes]
MYRKLLFLFLCGRTSTAPQQGVETIADVKPTIFDYPAEVYDLPAHYPVGDSLINGRPYSALYDMTTENIELETTDYNEELTDGYDKVTETIPRFYESGENTAELYSKIGYFTNNYLPGPRKLDINDGNQIKNVNVKYTEIRNMTDLKTTNSTKDKSNKIEETTTISEVKPTVDIKLPDNIDKVEDSFTESKNTLDGNKDFGNTLNIKNIANIVDDKPDYEMSKPSYFSNGRKGYLNENLVSKGRRKFRSNCRCEKIWNCPKLQITVPRCPDEYFMCCF